MGGINSLSGLNNVSVDFRPTIQVNEQKPGDANRLLPEADGAPGEAKQPQKAEARSVVQKLDVLLLNAAGKSVFKSIEKRMDAIGKSLVENGVISEKDKAKLVNLAKDASSKLAALDKFSGREIAKALMVDKKSEHGELVWGKGLFGLNATAKAVKTAVEAQQKLSEELAKLNDSLIGNKGVNPAFQDAFMELQFQCDRRSTEIYSVAVRMHDLVQQDVVNGTDADPQVAAYLDATFKELMPREAILMHGTAEALERMKGELGPLAEKLDAFTADGGKVLSKDELNDFVLKMATMKNAIAKVRANGIETNNGRIDVDKSLLAAMDKVLDETEAQLNGAKELSVKRTREAFLNEVIDNLSLKNVSGASGTTLQSMVFALQTATNNLVGTLKAFAQGKIPMENYDKTVNACIAQFGKPELIGLEYILTQTGYDPQVAKNVAKTVSGLHFIKAQFKELLISTSQLLKSDDDVNLATSDVRRIMLGERSLSSAVESKIRGFKPGDTDPVAEESNIVSSRELGAGAAGKTYLLTMKSGEELVFKPEMDSRIGLDDLLLGSGNAYLDKQKTANLNLATQDTAKAFGCEDVVVKYSVGSHGGQFGFFMEKAKGSSGSGFGSKTASGGGGIPPNELHKITDPGERTKIMGDTAQKLNRLMWLDLITGQGDRHGSNYFVHIDPTTHEVTVKGIDNDASFSATRIGLFKFALSKDQTALYEEELKKVCQKIHGKNWKTEYEQRVKNDPAIVRNGDTMTIDLTKAQSHEAKMAIIHTLGLQSLALPEEIDKEFYDKLMEMADPAKKNAYLDTIRSRVSPEALEATSKRIDEAIAYAQKLNAGGKVYGKEQWRDWNKIVAMTGVKANVTITKVNDDKLKVGGDIEIVSDYNERNCPSFFKREYLHKMFNKPV